MASFAQPEDDSVPTTVSTRPFDDDGYLGYDPRLPSQRFDSFVDTESLKDSATDSPIFHGSAVGDAFATQPASEAFSPQSIYAESNGQGFDGGFGGSDDPILPPPSEMLPEEGFALREWRRQNAIQLEEKERREKELLVQIIEEADEFKVGFYQKRKITTENNKAANREREKLFLANQEKFHAEVDKNYWKAIADLIPNEVPAIEKKRGKKDQEKKPSILVVQGPKPGKPTELSRMRQILLKLKHNTPPHLKPSPPAPAPAKDAKPSTSAPPKAAIAAATPEAVVASS
ncbi:clathrin light chain 2 [Pyrus x bretschneideri]|uniref:clathrin light chain 2 n=1 Tax=Pyrus x bretschneideri TaxID=225117 RepID=UPI002030DFF7|nr:clathrin light chain 2 [Pyrus x bretschneideri]